ncbi:3-hydroxyacyl-CoA dehydrogenase [Georgenia alba]|uniref:3-hydroxyacyl-CoA dehydrogenase n=1 Tax=Georgenia alba TaxID=2233858 RepID=A0ABW2Q9G9_9MICO
MTAGTGDAGQLTVGVLGGGALGLGFALRVALSRHVALVYEPDESRRGELGEELADRLATLGRYNLLDETPATVARRVVIVRGLAEAIRGSALVQECVAEDLDIKRAVVADAAADLGERTPMASSSSAIGPSRIFSASAVEDRGLVGHPLNPPHLIPVVEVVPSPMTDPRVTSRAEEVYRAMGMRPVLVHKEVDGFVTNRLQAALLREAYHLVADGVVAPDDVDALVRDGLGRRWCFMGPFETADLNTRGGIATHAERLGPAYARFGREREGQDPWRTGAVEEVTAARREILSLEDWPERVRWRDEEIVRRMARRLAVEQEE